MITFTAWNVALRTETAFNAARDLFLFYPMLSYKHRSSQTHTQLCPWPLFGQCVSQNQGTTWRVFAAALQARGGLLCWHMNVRWEDSLKRQTNLRWIRKKQLWHCCLLAGCWKIHQHCGYHCKIMHQLPVGNKVLKYRLMSRVRLCPCHNTLTALNDFLWALLGLLLGDCRVKK